MGNYTPPYTISEKMLERVSSISEKIGKITVRQTIESKPHLRRNNRIRSIYSSLKIEANSLSPDKVRDVNHFAETQGIRTLEKNLQLY